MNFSSDWLFESKHFLILDLDSGVLSYNLIKLKYSSDG